MGDAGPRPAPVPPAILVVVGASGAGKTTLVTHLASLHLPGVACFHFDAIGVPSDAEIAARFGDGFGFQAWALDQWIARIVRNADGACVAVLDAQVRPSAVRDAFAAYGITHGGTVLVDCAFAERNARLRGPRGQPELATAQMDGWAAYLRGQADALGVPVLDTSDRPEIECLAELRIHVEARVRVRRVVGRR